MDVLIDTRLREFAVAAERIVVALERIADALERERIDVNMCPHGGTGLCMSCVLHNDLLRPPR